MEEQQLTKKERKALKKQEQEANKQAQIEERRAAKVKRFTIISISAVIIIAFLGWLIQNAPERADIPQVAYAEDATPDVINPVSNEDNTKGAETPLVEIIEYSDFQCPACAAAYPFIKDVVENNPQIQFTYRHFPLPSHRNAFLAALYAEAAGMQGKFFEMHDMLFENQTVWSRQGFETAQETFEGYATSIGLDAETLTTDALSEATQAKVSSHYSDGLDGGVQWTPTFYINGNRVEDNGQLQQEIAGALSEAASAPTSNINVDAIQDVLNQAQPAE